MVFKCLAILLDVRNNRHRSRIAEWTERASEHVLGQILQVVDVFGHSAAGMEASQGLLHPVGALTTWNAPATALVLVELRHPQSKPDNAHVVVKYDDSAGAKHGAGLHHRLEIHRHVNFVRRE